jgi:glutathione S-transferase
LSNWRGLRPPANGTALATAFAGRLKRMSKATLTISSKNYSSWSLRGWLMARLSGLEFDEQEVPISDPANRAELLLLSPSVLVPRLEHDGVAVWDTMAIAEYLNEAMPKAGPFRRTVRRAPAAGPSAARCIRASPTCARRFP